ncbi:hypothetical protein, partial [Salmonella enterica]|uniref:hypothetical protein n=1 Tax=Salmonella enterica TaxID=28901 RepID=UPI00398C66E3
MSDKRVNNLTPQHLKAYGINDVQEIVYNPSHDPLFQQDLHTGSASYDRGQLTTPI